MTNLLAQQTCGDASGKPDRGGCAWLRLSTVSYLSTFNPWLEALNVLRYHQE
jgi:hypothetical protein